MFDAEPWREIAAAPCRGRCETSAAMVAFALPRWTRRWQLDHTAFSREEFTRNLRAVGEGGVSQQASVPPDDASRRTEASPGPGRIENRFYYQAMIRAKTPRSFARRKTALSRQAWIQRLSDQDGIERRTMVESTNGWCSPRPPDSNGARSKFPFRPAGGARFAVDAYLNLVESRSLEEAIASSLTEMFAPAIMSQRLPRSRNTIRGSIATPWNIFAPAWRRRRAMWSLACATLSTIAPHARSRNGQSQCWPPNATSCGRCWTRSILHT